MATSRPLMDHVSCGVCMEQYNSTHHIPKLLPCQHTFCLACLVSLHNKSSSTLIECPVCRCQHHGSPHDFTTNRLVMQIAEELQQHTHAEKPQHNSPTALHCGAHADMESVLVCVDCLTGLCMKCMKKLSVNPHKDHQLEEPSDAKPLLRELLEKGIRKQQSILQTEMTSATSVMEISSADNDIKEMCTLLTSVITEWQNDQLSITAKLKEEAAAREREIHEQNTKLEAALRNDIDVTTLITNLKQINKIRVQAPKESTYNFVVARETLLADLTSVITSENLMKSKFLEIQSPGATPRTDVPPRQKTTYYQGPPLAQDAWSLCSQPQNVRRSPGQWQDEADYTRKYHGRKGILQAMLNDNQRVPAHWTKYTRTTSFKAFFHKPTLGNVLVDVDAKTYAAIDKLVKGSWRQDLVGHGADAVGLAAGLKILVKKVQRIESPNIYRNYRTGLNFVCEEGLKGDFPSITKLDDNSDVLTATLKIPELEAIRTRELNEYFLFHGTKKEVVENIVVQGLDSRFSGTGLFGSGLYLSESSTKADQYADPKTGRTPRGTLLYMVVCRVILGHIYHQQGSAKHKRPPCRTKGCHKDHCSHHKRFDSVLGTHKNGGVRLNFRDFVVFDNQHVYPEFLVTYTRL